MADLLPSIERLLRDAADIALPFANGESQLKRDGSIVTEADLAVEDFLRPRLEKLVSGSSVMGEERGGETGKGPLWLVDPIDGTTNFARGSVHWAISVALIDDNEDTVVGAVLQPMVGRLWTAARGRGALRDGQAFTVPEVPAERGVLGTSLHGAGHDPHIVAAIRMLSGLILATRIQGAAAIDLCQVGTGELQIFFQHGLAPWDTGAAALIASEAGAVVTDFQGEPYHPLHSKTLLAASPDLHPTALEALGA